MFADFAQLETTVTKLLPFFVAIALKQQQKEEFEIEQTIKYQIIRIIIFILHTISFKGIFLGFIFAAIFLFQLEGSLFAIQCTCLDFENLVARAQ